MVRRDSARSWAARVDFIFRRSLISWPLMPVHIFDSALAKIDSMHTEGQNWSLAKSN